MDNTEQFNCISLCTGYAGIELGLERVIPNLRTVCYVEVEAFACANLVAKIEQGKLDAAPIWTDIKTFDGKPFRDRVHIITGGYPCQGFSVAGKRLGLKDPRHLWPYIERIIRTVRPVWCFFENVGGHLSIGFPEVYRSLRLMGYHVEAGLFTAAEVGAPHKRERLFILAHKPSKRLEGKAGASVLRKSLRFTSACRAAGELANSEHPEQGQGDKQETQAGIGWYRLAIERWPARPEQPQYDWEEPRVIVANAVSKRGWGKSGNAIHKGRKTGKAGGKGVPQDAERGARIAIPDNQSAGGNGAGEGQAQ